ncbi:MAG: hypothetical protein JRF69_13890, partial [Deltaproteobacteria bacterium]|nr:hypothetical protein [Deltaproteobacteria bacterium]
MCAANCHPFNPPPDSSYDPDGDGSGTYMEYYRAVGTFSCSDCHAYETEASHPTHADSSGKGVDLGCYDCHDSSHANNTVDFPDGPLSTTTACDACHSSGGHYDGVDMAKSSWSDGAYSVDGTTLGSGKEGWCATCHDDDGPTINGRTAKNVSGDDSIYGYFISGHGNFGVSCTDCHDPQLTHIDGYARTYHAEECDTDPMRSYQNGYRLALMNGGDPPLVVPRTEDYDSSHFALCYQCPRENVVVGGGNHTVGS